MTNQYIEIPCCKGPGFKIKVKELIHKSSSPYQEIVIYDTEPFGKCLILDGVIQCSESDHEIYDRAILKKLRKEDRRLLILGGGDGYTAEMALRINPDIEITIVDLDSAVVNACKTYLKQSVFDHHKVKLVIDDAFCFMAKAGEKSYDAIVCDLTDFPVGYNDGKFNEFYESIFSASKRLLSDAGRIAVYAGSSADSIIQMLNTHFQRIEKEEVLIPSFGEPSLFLYGEKSGATPVLEVIAGCDESILKGIMLLRDRACPQSWLEEDWTDYYRESLNNEKNINIVMKKDERLVGYLLAVPHNEAFIQMKDDDPEMKEDAGRFYVDLMVIDPEFQRGSGFLKMLHRMFEEAESRFGINSFSMHVRVDNGLSRVIQKYFGEMITTVRRIERWVYYNFEEPADYMEGTYKPTEPGK